MDKWCTCNNIWNGSTVYRHKCSGWNEKTTLLFFCSDYSVQKFIFIRYLNDITHILIVDPQTSFPDEQSLGLALSL